MNSIKLIVLDFDHTIGHFNSGIERVVDVLHIREEALAVLLRLRGDVEREVNSPTTLTSVLTDVLKIAEEDEAIKNKLLNVARSRKNGEE